MAQTLLALNVRGKKDLVLIRQRTRQLAALLGYGAEDQAVLAAGVFDQACQVHRCFGPTAWNFCVAGRNLQIFPGAGDAGQIQKRLPDKGPLSTADIRWVIRELGRLAPLDLFGELQKLNQEFLQTLLEAPNHQGRRAIRPAA